MKDKWGKDPLPNYYEPTENKYTTPEIYSKYPLSLVSSHAYNKMNSQFSDITILKEEPFVWINPYDAEKRGINDGDKVKVYSERGSLILKTILTEKIFQGIVHIYFGWWDTIHKVSINKLIGDYESDIGNGTAFHSCLVEVQKVEQN